MNEFSWNTKANVMYLEQPAGVGFSKGTPPTNSVKAADSTYVALIEFFRSRPKYNTRVFLAGQSFAGHYIPPLAAKLQGSLVRLEGIILGNAAVAPEIQWGSFPRMLVENGIISRGEYGKAEKKATKCIEKVHACNELRKALDQMTSVDEKILKKYIELCIEAKVIREKNFILPVTRTGKSCYHLDQGCVELDMDPTILKVTAYFNSENTQRFFDQNSVWSVFNRKVYAKLAPDMACNYHQYLPELLDKGLRILVYAGDRDLVCNWVGSLAWMEALRWGGRGGFSRAQPVEYSLLNGTAIGSLKSYSLPITGGQLSFVKVYGAGHSVAMDVPRQALKMLTDFLENKFP